MANQQKLSDLEKAQRVLSSLGRPVGHAAGLYRKRLPELAALWDEEDQRLEPGARDVWTKLHCEVVEGHKGADEVTDQQES